MSGPLAVILRPLLPIGTSITVFMAEEEEELQTRDSLKRHIIQWQHPNCTMADVWEIHIELSYIIHVLKE